MNILVDIGHPAHVHLFRILIRRLYDQGHQLTITARNKDITIPLLNEFGFDFILVGSNRKSIFGKLMGLFVFTKRMIAILKKQKIDITISHSSIYVAIAARLLGKYSITLEDTGNNEQVLLYRPFTNLILTPVLLNKKYGKKQLTYPSFHESAYLHSDIFNPDISVLEELNVEKGEKYIIVRFVARKSSHDLNESSIPVSKKVQIINELSKHVRVFISSEESLPEAIRSFKLPTQYSRIHHAMNYAKLVFGESATMCSEAAFLGVPSILIDKKGRDYTNFLEENYGLVKNFIAEKYDIESSLSYAIDSIKSKTNFDSNKDRLHQDHINLTNLLFHLITDYPDSLNELGTNKFNMIKSYQSD